MGDNDLVAAWRRRGVHANLMCCSRILFWQEMPEANMSSLIA